MSAASSYAFAGKYPDAARSDCTASGRPLSLHEVTVAGRYRLERLLGSGGSGSVYLARTIPEGQRVALKVLSRENAMRERARLRFDREARMCLALQHPNLVRVIDRGRHRHRLYLVMELVEGESLADLIHDQAPLPPATAIALARQIAAGLAYAHDRDMLHRDLKPENVMVTAEGRVKIIDFGLAISPSHAEAKLTCDGLVVGTPEYLAPEQACGEPVTGRSDVFALGLILYELLAGKRPYAGESMQVTRQIVCSAPPPVFARSPGVRVPRDVERLLFRLLDRRPSNRPTAEEARAQLEELEELEARLGT